MLTPQRWAASRSARSLRGHRGGLPEVLWARRRGRGFTRRANVEDKMLLSMQIGAGSPWSDSAEQSGYIG